MSMKQFSASLFRQSLPLRNMLSLSMFKRSRSLIAYYYYLFILLICANLPLTRSHVVSSISSESGSRSSSSSSSSSTLSDQLELNFEIEENVPPGTLIGIIQTPKESPNEAHPPFLIVPLPTTPSTVPHSYTNSSHLYKFNFNGRYYLNHADQYNRGVDTDLNIDQSSGEIRSAIILDRETTGFYSFIAIPISGPNIKVSIIVLDTNDNAPQFPSSSINLEFPENSKVRDVKRTLPPAIDLDLGK